MEIGRPAFIWGAPGIGKSAIVRQMAGAMGRSVVDIRAPLLDPTDLRGLPAVVDGRAVWAPPSFLPQEGEKPGILFFDELNAAPPLVQASLYQLVLDRRVGEYTLPDGWAIVAAGNRAEDRSVVFRMPAALANRFVHVELEASFDDWSEWASSAGVSPVVISFLAVRRELLAPKSNESGSVAFASPRSWEMLSDTFRALGTTSGALEIYQGCVGKGTAIEFLEHAKRALSMADIERILLSPQDAVLPTNPGDIWVLVQLVVQRVEEAPVRAALGALLTRLGAEWSVRMVRDILRRMPSMVTDPQIAAFARRHADIILPAIAPRQSRSAASGHVEGSGHPDRGAARSGGGAA
jgi:hypothetical protein